MKIKNWKKYQHYTIKNKRYQAEMGWFKVYGRQILNDHKWFALTSEQQAMIFQFWCLASQFEGKLPDLETMSFRLRKDKDYLLRMLKELEGWIVDDLEEDLSEENVIKNINIEYLSPDVFI